MPKSQLECGCERRFRWTDHSRRGILVPVDYGMLDKDAVHKKR